MEMNIEDLFNDMKSRCRIALLNRYYRISLRVQCLVFALDVQARDVVNISEMFEEYILGGGKIEHGGIRGVALIKEEYIPLDASGKIDGDKVEELSWWENGIRCGQIHVIPKTRGDFDGGRIVVERGCDEEIPVGKAYKLIALDPDHRKNEGFYAAVAEKNGAFWVAWRTDSELRISGSAVRINPTDPIDEDIFSQVVWRVYYTWYQERAVVQVFDAEKIKCVFDCEWIQEINDNNV